MANLNFVNDLNQLLTMDEPVTKGPLPRWQKKILESSNTSINASLNSTSVNSNLTSKTPSKKSSYENKKTPGKTPGKSPGCKSNPVTPGHQAGGDRFIPSRSASNFDLGHFLVNKSIAEEETEETKSPQKENQRILSETIHGGDINNMRILSYQNKAPAPPEGYMNPLKVMYSQTKTPSSTKSNSRYIPQSPERILDAPDIVDDYYLNLIDWSSINVLAVALANCVYLWNAATGAIEELLELEGNDYVCSVSWIQEGNYLAVGTFTGATQLWDCNEMKRLRTMEGHTARVCSHSWNQYILSSGSRSGQIIHHDVRQRDHAVSVLNGHTEEVCGLKWSPDGRFLASGGNDNLLNIWPQLHGQLYTRGQPLHVFNAHQAAVKALAWCPWQPGVLASGGGTADRCIRIWNANSGTLLNTTDTKSQVCALQWSVHYKEMISGHGYANNQLTIWKYPSMNKVAELTGHTARVLHLCTSPDGSSIMSAGADETLRLWKCFAPDIAKKTEKPQIKSASSFLKQSLR